eukprot:CAMPEP_0185563602 /NCGR_PEP_ID=MMETSP1381-20130426/63815_1 /TAXON_ID=298111 /ORGANISM="Pavlova sp., Strain CCMP459" /LENGTH=55 /DNA_ID=CAMNT_0028177493 /DNA_START=128 /DNA_END=291 /DNA_ORIENTATION=-
MPSWNSSRWNSAMADASRRQARTSITMSLGSTSRSSQNRCMPYTSIFSPLASLYA